jgi:hypothetical protein
MPARNPEAVRQRAIAAAHQRRGQLAAPTLDPVFVALNPGALPARSRPEAELYQWVRREEQYAILGANVVVELTAKATPAGQPPAPGQSSAAPNVPSAVPATAKGAASAATPTAPIGPIAPADLTNPRRGGWLRMLDDPTHPDQLDSESRLRPTARHLCAGT